METKSLCFRTHCILFGVFKGENNLDRFFVISYKVVMNYIDH
jgi:hypothetical protein